MKTKVTLHNSESDELELGPFPQGVVLEDNDITDVATGETIAVNSSPSRDWQEWRTERAHDDVEPEAYGKVFIQPVPEEELPTMAQGFGNRVFCAPAGTPPVADITDIMDPITGALKEPWVELSAS